MRAFAIRSSFFSETTCGLDEILKQNYMQQLGSMLYRVGQRRQEADSLVLDLQSMQAPRPPLDSCCKFFEMKSFNI